MTTHDLIDKQDMLIRELRVDLYLLADAVLEAHTTDRWDSMEDQIVEAHCYCEVCQTARKYKGVSDER